MNSLDFASVSLESLDQVAKNILNQFSDHTIWLLNGPMGAGKTTFVKALCRIIGCKTNASSPSFGIINEYETIHKKSIYHFDCYRFNSEDEAYDIGLEEYLDSGNLCLIEWSEKIPNLIPSKHIIITITVENNTLRTITVNKHG